ncbi:MAG: GNAT family N-acetyltransferase [Bacteroidetes bacterium]|nr:GNAT family N-acetyltransferase [Bacteroidota bacterium]
MKELNYRTASENDLKQLQELGLLAYGQYKSTITKENWEKWDSSFKSDENFLNLLAISTCFVCEIDNEIVGMAFFIPSGNPFLYFPAEWSYIRYVGVNPAYVGKGIGKILTQKCVDAAKNKGEKIIALHTSEFQNAARHIYEKLGFIKQKELEPVFGKIFWIYTLEVTNL